MKNFSYRAECSADVERFHQVCAQRGMIAFWTMHSDKVGPDVEVDLQSTASVEDLRNAMREVEDGHVMLQTLRECPLAENTLERDYAIH